MPNPNEPPSGLRWIRLFDGRLWHAETADRRLTWCGRLDPGEEGREPERLADSPPVNAWVCDRCVRRIVAAAEQAKAAWTRDPRITADQELTLYRDLDEVSTGA